MVSLTSKSHRETDTGPRQLTSFYAFGKLLHGLYYFTFQPQCSVKITICGCHDQVTLEIIFMTLCLQIIWPSHDKRWWARKLISVPALFAVNFYTWICRRTGGKNDTKCLYPWHLPHEVRLPELTVAFIWTIIQVKMTFSTNSWVNDLAKNRYRKIQMKIWGKEGFG